MGEDRCRHETPHSAAPRPHSLPSTHVSDQQRPQPYSEPQHQPGVQYQPPQYAAPAPGAPHQPPRGYAPGAYPQHSAPGYAPAPSATGVRHWAWQLLYWIPLPLLPLLVVPIVLFGLRSGAVRAGGIDEANSRAAINWSLTWLAAIVVTGLLHVGLLWVLTGDGGSVSGSSPLGGVLATTGSLFGIAYLGGGVLTLINLVRGWLAALRGEIARPWLAIPFLRAPHG